MEHDEHLKFAEMAGFEHYGILDIKTVRLLPEVRAMCMANTCGMYGRNWSCPPGCGTLEECEVKVIEYDTGLIVQTVGKVEDSFDFEGMAEIQERHHKRFYNLNDILSKMYNHVLPLGDGPCTICKECTYPYEPCRFKEKAISSMESYGILVSDLCRDNGLDYYYGPGTISYTGCFLFFHVNETERKH